MTQDLRVLTTSRAPLGLSSEAVYLLPELSLPTAVELFIQRARAAHARRRPARRGGGGDLPPPGRAAAGRGAGGGAGPGAVGGRDRPRRLGHFGLLRGGARDAPSAADPRGRGRLELEPAGAVRAGGDAGAVSLPGRVHRRRRPAGARRRRRRRRCRGPGAPGRPVAAPGGRHPGRARFRMLETVREFSTAQREAAGRPTGRSAASWPGPATSAWPPRRRLRAEHRSRRCSGSGPSRTTSPRRSGTAWPARTATPWRPPPPCSGACGSSSPSTRCWCRSPPRRPGCCRTSGPGPPRRGDQDDPGAVHRLHLPPPGAPGRALAGRLRRLPPAPPDTLVQAVATVLAAAAQDRAALYELCDSDEPLVAGAANGVVGYFWENEGDLDSAVAAARRTLEAFEQRSSLPGGRRPRPHQRAVPAGRAGRGGPAPPAGGAAGAGAARDRPRPGRAPVVAGPGQPPGRRRRPGRSAGWSRRRRPRPTSRSARSPTASGCGPRSCSPGARSRPACACGGAADLLAPPTARSSAWTRTSQETWPLEAKTVTVVAHAWHGQLDLVEAHNELPDRLSRMLANPVPNPPPYLMERPISGGLLLALAVVDLDRGTRRRPAGDQVGGADDRPGRALPVPAQLPAHHVRRPCGPGPSRPTGRRTTTRVVVRRPGRGGCGPPPGRAAGAAEADRWLGRGRGCRASLTR